MEAGLEPAPFRSRAGRSSTDLLHAARRIIATRDRGLPSNCSITACSGPRPRGRSISARFLTAQMPRGAPPTPGLGTGLAGLTSLSARGTGSVTPAIASCHHATATRPRGRGWGRAVVVGMGDDARHRRHRQPPRGGSVRACVSLPSASGQSDVSHRPGPPRPGIPPPGERRVGCRLARPSPSLRLGRAGRLTSGTPYAARPKRRRAILAPVKATDLAAVISAIGGVGGVVVAAIAIIVSARPTKNSVEAQERTTEAALSAQHDIAADERLWQRRADVYIQLLAWAELIRQQSTLTQRDPSAQISSRTSRNAASAAPSAS